MLAVDGDMITSFYCVKRLELRKNSVSAVILVGSWLSSMDISKRLFSLCDYHRITGRYPGCKICNPDNPIQRNKERKVC